MKISYNWLQQHIELKESPQEIADMLTRSGLEVEKTESYESIPGGLRGLVIAEVLTCEKHPDADKLKKTTVSIGNNTILPVVCGAVNVAAGQKVVLATVGTTLYPAGKEPFTIGKTKIRGEASEGMICAEDEIGLGTSHEGIIVLDTYLPPGTPAAEYYKPETDTIFEIGLTPNRADAASHLGVARDLKALLQRELKKDPSGKEIKPGKTILPAEIIIENKKACPRYSGITISNLTVKDSPEWLQQKLKAIGLSPINNVVDVTNYILHDLGQPLHAFDYDKISSRKVVVQTLLPGTEFITLDGQKRKLSSEDLMICDEKKPMCIAGVFGGIESGVTANTKNIFLESACFSPDYIRRTSQQHGLKTDASFRFERGTDPDMTITALKRAALLILGTAGGEVSSEIMDVYPDPVKAFSVQTSYERINRLIGENLDKEIIKRILTDLEISVSEKGGNLELSVPPYRVDVQREADIVEEVLRIYGYDNIHLSERLRSDFLAAFPEKDKDTMQRDISQVLAGMGFSEIITNSLSSESYVPLLKHENEKEVLILNKLSEELGAMRQSLLFSGLEVLAYNINRRQKDLKLYEFGKTYHLSDNRYIEKDRLGIFITGDYRSESWQSPSMPADIFLLKSVVSRIFSRLHLNENEFETESADVQIFSSGLTYKNKSGVIVTFGRIQEKLLKIIDLKQPVYFADFDAALLFRMLKDDFVYQEIPKFPEVRRDLSLVLDKKVTFDQIRRLAMEKERKLLRKINVFDVYEGENIGPDKKSYSISFILQDQEQTLTDKVIDSVMQKLMGTFEKDLGAIIRK